MRPSGTIRNSVPRSPNTSTSGVVSSGPSAKPAFPPTEKRLIPLARRAPET